MECYGNYGKKSHCQQCECAEWCKDAADPPLLRDYGAMSPLFESMEDKFDFIDEKPGGSGLSKLLGELIYELDKDNAELLWDFLATMSALSKEKPNSYRVVRVRILYPGETYDQLASRLGTTKSEVCNHLKAVADMIPELRASIGIPSKRLSKGKRTTFEIKCSGNKIRVLCEGGDMLEMPMTMDNATHAPLVVEALNNLHWRRLEALTDKLKEKSR